MPMECRIAAATDCVRTENEFQFRAVTSLFNDIGMSGALRHIQSHLKWVGNFFAGFWLVARTSKKKKTPRRQ